MYYKIVEKRMIGAINWTNNGGNMYVSRLKGWQYVNKISNRSTRQSIHIAEGT